MILPAIIIISAILIYFRSKSHHGMMHETGKKPIQAFVIPEDRVIEGEKIFSTHCISCHGPGGGGQDKSRPQGGKDKNGLILAPALNGTGHTWHHPPMMNFFKIKNGSQAPDSPMRGFRGKITDEQIKSVIWFLYSIWPEEIKSRYQHHMTSF